MDHNGLRIGGVVETVDTSGDYRYALLDSCLNYAAALNYELVEGEDRDPVKLFSGMRDVLEGFAEDVGRVGREEVLYLKSQLELFCLDLTDVIDELEGGGDDGSKS